MDSGLSNKNLMTATQWGAVDKGVALRRFIHVLTGFGPAYYLIPVNILPGLQRATALVILLLFVLGFESVRIQLSIKIIGLRAYEYSRLSGFAWAFLGIATVVIFFPAFVAVPCLVAMALMDPLAGEMRAMGSKRLPDIILPVSFVIFIVSFGLFGMHLAQAVPLALVGAIISWLSEKLKFKPIDDDYLMSVLPAVGIMALRLLL